MSLRPRIKPADDDAAAGSSSTDAERPKLSLKPKAKPAEPASLPADTGDREASVLSLKPKLAEPEVKSAEAPAPETAAPEAVASRAKPKFSISLEGDEAKEPTTESTPKLKPKLSLGTDSATIPSAEEKLASVPEPPVTVPPAPEAAEEQPPVAEHRDETNPALDPAVREALQKVKTEKPKLKLSISKPVEAVAPEETPEEPAEPAPKIDLPPPPGY